MNDNIEMVFAAFQKDFSISEINRPHTVRYFEVTEKSTQRKWFDFSVNEHNKIIIVDITGPCVTKEGIGVGSTLRQAMKAYGRPKLSPSGDGYHVFFKRFPLVGFLLNDADLPAQLRGIPDDVLTKQHEMEILKYRKARIVAIELSTEE